MTVAETLQFFAVYDKAIEFCGVQLHFLTLSFSGRNDFIARSGEKCVVTRCSAKIGKEQSRW